MPIQAIQTGHRYFIVFVDDATRYWTVYLLTNKSQAAEAFYQYKAMMELQTGYKVKCLHDDKEGGLSSNEFNSNLKKWGIVRRFCVEKGKGTQMVRVTKWGEISNRLGGELLSLYT